MDLTEYMRLALEEAKASLREGNNGFGAVIIKDAQVIASAHDKENTDRDPTSHAEINAIKAACQKIGRNFQGCILVSTHEPCPMCASAIVWSGITELAYGYSIQEALSQGRRRIALSCAELFQKAGVDVRIHMGILHDECSLLYRSDVRSEIKKLRNITDEQLQELNLESANRRVQWFKEKQATFSFKNEDPLCLGYKLLLKRFNITEQQAPISIKSESQLVFHSQNFCPTLEACKILGLDTRIICKKLNENATDALIKQIDPRLEFSRNYDKLRPYTEYCEEMIKIKK